MSHSPSQQSTTSQPVHSTSVTVTTRTEEECRRQGTNGLAMGAGGSGLLAYAMHKIMENQSPAYVTSSRNVKMAVGVGVVGLGAYFTGRYYENKCRKERGLPLI